MLVARIRTPDLIERGKVQDLTLPVHDGADLRAPDSGSFRMLDENGQIIIAAGAVTVVERVATKALVAGDTSALVFSKGYVEEWALIFGTTTETIRRDAILCHRLLYPVIADDDLYDLHDDLRELLPSTRTSWEFKRQEAWNQIIGRLIRKGNLPNLIMQPWALRDHHLFLTLHLIATDLMTTESGEGKWAKLASGEESSYDKKADNAWKELQFTYDEDEDGNASRQQRAAEPQFFMTDVPEWPYGQRSA
jgi:hypothetical protein